MTDPEQNTSGTHDHPHVDGDAHDHDHPHDHADSEHGHSHGTGISGWLNTIFHFHGHSEQKHNLAADAKFTDTQEGIRAVWLALASLAITFIFQVVIVLWSGSVSLLADTIHNLGDALNSIPLLIAFYLARRVANRRYTYGYARAEDVAGVLIVLSIAFSAGVVFWQSFQKLLNPQPMSNLGWVAAASLVGFLGNEAVAFFQIRVGRKIGSAALVADGLHARTDGLTSLAVLLAVGGTFLGFPIVDPIIGILIGIAILFITRDATVSMWYRLMDAVDPKVTNTIEQAAKGVSGIVAVHSVRARWMGHRLHADLGVTVDEDLPLRETARIAEDVRHALFHAQPQLTDVNVMTEPCGHGGGETQRASAHHTQPRLQASTSS